MKLAAAILANRPEFVESALAQVRAQTLPHIEIVVRGVTGVSRARNIAMQRAREAGADAIAFIDDDDLYAPWYLEEVAAALQSHPATGKPVQYMHDVEADQYWLSGERSDAGGFVAVSGGTLAFLLRGAPSFNEKLSRLEDFDWCLQAHFQGLAVHGLPAAGYLKRQYRNPHHAHTYRKSLEELTHHARRLPGEPDWRNPASN